MHTKTTIFAVLLAVTSMYSQCDEWMRLGSSSEVSVDVMKNSGERVNVSSGGIIYTAVFRNVTDSETQMYRAFVNVADCKVGLGVVGFASMNSVPITKNNFSLVGNQVTDAVAKMLCIAYAANN